MIFEKFPNFANFKKFKKNLFFKKNILLFFAIFCKNSGKQTNCIKIFADSKSLKQMQKI
jgi:hypothetical protein